MPCSQVPTVMPGSAKPTATPGTWKLNWGFWPEIYADSSRVKANANSHQSSRSGLAMDRFREQAIKENELFTLSESGVDVNCDGLVQATLEYDNSLFSWQWEETRHFQDSKGPLPLSLVDINVRWRSSRSGKPPELNYQDNAIGYRGGFTLSGGVTHASEGEWKELLHLLDRLLLLPAIQAVDTAYIAG